MLWKSRRSYPCGAGDIFGCSTLSFIVCVCLFGFGQPAWAAVVATGDLDPADPTTWDDNTAAYVGHTSDGSVTVDSGDDLLSQHAYIAYASGYAGEVTVSGANST